MSKTLVIVESPAKAKTIEKYLGKGFQVQASVGARARPTGEKARGGYRAWLPAHLRSVGREGEGDCRDPSRRRECVIYLPRHRPRSRGGRRSPGTCWRQRSWTKPKTQRIVFHQVTKAAVEESHRQSQGAGPRLDRRAASAARARPAGGLPDQPDPEQDAAQAPFGGAGAERGAPAGSRSGARDPRLRAGGVLDAGRRAAAPKRRSTSASWRWLHKVAGKDPGLAKKEDVDRILTALKGATYQVKRVEKGERQDRPQAAFHHQHLAGRGGAQIALQSATDDALCAAALRRDRPGGGSGWG